MSGQNYSQVPDDGLAQKAVRPGGRATDRRLLFDDADGSVACTRSSALTAVASLTPASFFDTAIPVNDIANGLAIIDMQDRLMCEIAFLAHRNGADPNDQTATARCWGYFPVRYGQDSGSPRQRWYRRLLWESSSGGIVFGQKEATFMPDGGTANRTAFADALTITSYLPASPPALSVFGVADDESVVLFDALGCPIIGIEMTTAGSGTLTGINGLYRLI